MQNSKFKIIIQSSKLVIFLILGLLPCLVLAQPDPSGKLKKFAEEQGVGYAEKISPAVYIGKVLNIIYSFLGLIGLILVIYGGFKWLTAEGSQEDIQKAKKIITNTIIGLVILFSAYAITQFVVEQLTGA